MNFFDLEKTTSQGPFECDPIEEGMREGSWIQHIRGGGHDGRAHFACMIRPDKQVAEADARITIHCRINFAKALEALKAAEERLYEEGHTCRVGGVALLDVIAELEEVSE